MVVILNFPEQRRPSAKVGKWTVTMNNPTYGWSEHDEWGEGGGLWFDSDKTLNDYDGTYACLPQNVVKAIEQLGYKVPEDMR